MATKAYEDERVEDSAVIEETGAVNIRSPNGHHGQACAPLVENEIDNCLVYFISLHLHSHLQFSREEWGLGLMPFALTSNVRPEE